jgi:hypothetical protein
MQTPQIKSRMPEQWNTRRLPELEVPSGADPGIFEKNLPRPL